MAIQPIRAEADHDAAIARIKALWDAQPGTPEHDELEVLSVLVSVYKDARWPIVPPDPVEVIKFHMQRNGFRQKDLAGVIGSVSRASEVLNRRRPLAVGMIKAIHTAWSVAIPCRRGGTGGLNASGSFRAVCRTIGKRPRKTNDGKTNDGRTNGGDITAC